MMQPNQDFIRFAMVFRLICRHPENFTVCGTLREVLSFLSGLYIGLYRVPAGDMLAELSPDDPMEGFNRWLACKDRCEQSADWARTAYMVLKVYDDDEAFDYLRQLFDQYISEQLGITPESYQNKLF